MDILGVEFGLSVSPSELRQKITAKGWRIDQSKFDKKRDRYLVKAISTRGDTLERTGKSERLALANLLLAVSARSSHTRLGRWQTVFTDRLQAIAEAYSKAPVYTVKAAEPFLALAKDCERRVDVLGQHLEIEIVNDPEPYKSAEKMIDDVRKRRKLIVSRAGTLHPIWSEQQVVAYRICHDVLGYAAANAGWDWEGENEAFAHHVHLLNDQAQQALFTESIAVAAYTTFYHAFGPQKVAVFPQFLGGTQDKENPHKGWHGIHPDESYPPIEMPSVKPIVSRLSSVDEEPRFAAVNPEWTDPNYGWKSGVEPITLPNGLSIKQTYGDPLGEDEGRAMAAKLNRPWEQVQDPTLRGQIEQNQAAGGPGFTDREFEYLKTQLPKEYERMREAISNAFRAVLLSPKTQLFANALHYQMLSHGPQRVPAGGEDPHEYHRALDTARRRYNVERFEELNPGQGELAPSHKAWAQFHKAFTRYVAEMKQLPLDQAATQAQNIIDELQQQEEDKLMEAEERKPEAKRQFPFQLESAAGMAVAATLKALLAAHRKKQDFALPEGPLQQFAAVTTDGDTIQDASQTQDVPDLPGLPGPRRYPGWMYGQSINIARMGPYIDDILKAALEDVHNHDATGHHFRSRVLQLNIPSVGPKVISFAWLLLQPLTSELATMDTHMMNVMGSTEDAPKPRDYFGWERAFRARMDAMGYNHVPTGLAQWLIWDHERTGGGTHQNHASLAPLTPEPWHAVDWHEGEPPDPNWAQKQEWWAQTQPLQDQMMDQYSEQLAPKTPQGVVPYLGMPKWGIGSDLQTNPPITSKVAGSAFTGVLNLRSPYFVHPWTGEKIMGQPGDTIMGHATKTLGLPVPEIWRQLALAEAGKS